MRLLRWPAALTGAAVMVVTSSLLEKDGFSLSPVAAGSSVTMKSPVTAGTPVTTGSPIPESPPVAVKAPITAGSPVAAEAAVPAESPVAVKTPIAAGSPNAVESPVAADDGQASPVSNAKTLSERRFPRRAALTAPALDLLEAGASAVAGWSPVRYAGLAGCVCAPWRLWTQDGRMVRLTDARVFSKGKQRVPLALSPDGQHVAYFLREGGALVIREMSTGKVREVPGVTWSPELRGTRIDLAPARRYVVLGSGRDNTVLDAYSGEGAAVPPGLRPWSFSPDARFMLAVDDAFKAGIYSTPALIEVGRVPTGGALSPGGTTVAHFTNGDSAISLWDVTDGVAGRGPIALPAKKTPTRLRWDSSGNLDLQTVVPRATGNRRSAVYAWYRVDQESGRLQKAGAFTVPGSVYSPIVAGLNP
ncbi:hypothetical protein [Streptosporangium sp. NPDC000396]|uniref:hypothetical protein n=1 Tax=Streptosporangium sp. NPDC000396 TaxID=3366185 RepID=UPI003692A255